MLKKIIKKIVTTGIFAGILLTTTTANALLIVDTVDQSAFVGWFDTYEYTHNLLDDGFIPGTATSGTIEIQFSDDNKGWFENWEVILVVVDTFDFDTGGLLFSASSFYNDLEVNALAKINDTGMLDITIGSLLGDFYVGQSVLSVEVNDVLTAEVSDIPEPSILAIFGLGLLGLGISHRIRKT